MGRDIPPRPAIRTPPEALGNMLGMAFGKAEPASGRSRPRLRPVGRALRRVAGRLDDAGVVVAKAGELMSSSSSHVYRLAGRLDPRPYRHTFTLPDVRFGVLGEPPREERFDR